MVVAKNVTRIEGIIRAILGVIFIVLGLSVSGFWRPVSVVVGILLVLTAFVGY